MRLLTTIAIWVLSIACLLQPVVSIAGGPGFDNDVYTWGNNQNNTDDDDSNSNYNDNDDDDSNNWSDDDDGYYNCDDDDFNNDIPLDGGGLSILGAAGVAYGIKRLKDRKAEKKNDK